MTTSTVHSDVIGSSFTNTQANPLKMRATRKFIVKSDVDTSSGGGLDTIVSEMKGETGSSPNITTQLGPLYKDPFNSDQQTSGGPIVHPSNNDCFLLTVDVAVLGDQRYLVTAQYGVEQGFGGSASAPATTAQFRASTRTVRKYRKSDLEREYELLDSDNLETDVNPVQFSDMETIPTLKIQVPFYRLTSPVGEATYAAIGGLNQNPVFYNGRMFGENSVRFDGVQMDEYGGAATTSGGVPYKYRGYYEFTVDSAGFMEERPVMITDESGTKRWQVRSVLSNVTEARWIYDNLWYS
jgi:hypothetical protein